MSDDKLNLDNLDIFAGQEEAYEYVSMVDDDGNETDFVVMDGIDADGVRYMLLVKTEDFDKDEPEAFIFKEIEVNDEECTYEPVTEDEEYKRVLLLLQDEDARYEMKF